MPKNSFEQPIKREEPPIEEMEKKLDKAEKMVEEVKERWKDKIEEFEMVEKPVKELKKLCKENKEKIEKKEWVFQFFSFLSSLPLPKTPPSFLERVSNKFLKEFDWENFKGGKYLEGNLGLFLSAFLNKNIENYVLSQKKKGIKEEDIEPIEVRLKVKELPVVLGYLGYKNPKKLHLIIEGNCSYQIGECMQGGEIIVKGDCGVWIGLGMRNGKIIVEGNCGDEVGMRMKGGKLDIRGEVKSFGRSAFYSDNQGTIIWKGTKIWEKGNWTKEGKEMKEKGEIPV